MQRVHKLWLVRHAPPLIAPGICYGRLNMAADALATEQAALALANALHTTSRTASSRQTVEEQPAKAPHSPLHTGPSTRTDIRWSMRYSPLQRCEQLALSTQALAPNLLLSCDARLQEMDFGAWEGQPWDQLPRDAIDHWAQQLAHVAPGGGETLTHMLQRVGAALHDTIHTPPATGCADPSAIAEQHSIWVTHAGVARCVQWLLAHGNALPDSASWQFSAPAPGQWMCVDLPIPLAA